MRNIYNNGGTADINDIAGFEKHFPLWEKLGKNEREKIAAGVTLKKIKKGEQAHSGSSECSGLILVRKGRMRVYIISDEGREITIYRLLEGDICLFSASCMMRSVRFDVMAEAEEDTSVWIIPAEIYEGIMENSAACANYTNEIMGERFSDVMWLMEQVMWRSFDKRLAGFITEEAAMEKSLKLKITHDMIAAHMGTAREVVTRMLRYMQNEGFVRLSRGMIEITDLPGLKELSGRD